MHVLSFNFKINGQPRSVSDYRQRISAIISHLSDITSFQVQVTLRNQLKVIIQTRQRVDIAISTGLSRSIAALATS